jgi:2-keto-3-deoxy-L-rhamnonate aldolase RhmA
MNRAVPDPGPNRLKRKLKTGELSLISGNHESSDLVDFTGSLGVFDGVWIDMQFGPVTVERLPDLSRAADLWGMSSLVRVRDNDPPLIAQVLATGVHGVIVPRVTTKADAERIVEAAKFPPQGRRPASGGRRGYGRGAYLHHTTANEETIVAVMIEDIEAVERLDEIVAVSDIDMFFVGHYDLALSMGLGPNVDDPRVVDIYDQAVGTIVAAGRVAGAVVKEGELDKYLGLGVRSIKLPLWQNLFAGGARSFVEKIGAARPSTGKT